MRDRNGGPSCRLPLSAGSSETAESRLKWDMFWRASRLRLPRLLSHLLLEGADDLASDTAPEGQHAGDEDRALNHRHPLTEAGEILLHGDDGEGADHRSEDGAEAADQGHQHDLA